MKYILIALLFVYAVNSLPQGELEEGEVAIRPAQWGCGGGCSCGCSSQMWMCKPCMPSCCTRTQVLIKPVHVPVPVPVFVTCCSSSDTSCC
ncbi:hypothetical protein PVAND_000315 [Polypedilum vanderplanki]|uniref:Uncharacterized protein n=1 Tax=Polypedilum vanderplanki TaxID=319348 RepID=A0A9J6BJM3_POLVA|nr:hypothetical protein PVAND_000315 [Polypedilum vanderplanki]